MYHTMHSTVPHKYVPKLQNSVFLDLVILKTTTNVFLIHKSVMP